jgi:hypothetical protein
MTYFGFVGTVGHSQFESAGCLFQKHETNRLRAVFYCHLYEQPKLNYCNQMVIDMATLVMLPTY